MQLLKHVKNVIIVKEPYILLFYDLLLLSVSNVNYFYKLTNMPHT